MTSNIETRSRKGYTKLNLSLRLFLCPSEWSSFFLIRRWKFVIRCSGLRSAQLATSIQASSSLSSCDRTLLSYKFNILTAFRLHFSSWFGKSSVIMQGNYPNRFYVTQTVHCLMYRISQTNYMHTLLCIKMFELHSYMFRTVIRFIFK
jgi:hypothetical protein